MAVADLLQQVEGILIIGRHPFRLVRIGANDEVLCIHDCPLALPTNYVHDQQIAAMAFGGVETGICLIGHTHVPMVFEAPGADAATDLSAADVTAYIPGHDVPIELDPEMAARLKRERDNRLHTQQIPLLRLVGFAFFAAGVGVHNWLIDGHVSWPVVVRFAILVIAYSLLSWLVLKRFYGRTGWLNLGDFFLVVDVFFLVMAVYLTGIYMLEENRKAFEKKYAATGKKLDAGKSCVRFKKLEDLPLELIGECIAADPVDEFCGFFDRMASARARKSAKKKASKKKTKKTKKAAGKTKRTRA